MLVLGEGLSLGAPLGVELLLGVPVGDKLGALLLLGEWLSLRLLALTVGVKVGNVADGVGALVLRTGLALGAKGTSVIDSTECTPAIPLTVLLYSARNTFRLGALHKPYPALLLKQIVPLPFLG